MIPPRCVRTDEAVTLHGWVSEPTPKLLMGLSHPCVLAPLGLIPSPQASLACEQSAVQPRPIRLNCQD